MTWKELYQIIEEKGLTDKEVSLSMDVRSTEGNPRDLFGSLFSYMTIDSRGSMSGVFDEIVLDEDDEIFIPNGF